MQLGMIGSGKMGGNVTQRLLKGGHRAVAYDRRPKPVQANVASGATASHSIAHLAARLSGPRAVLRMVPAGQPTDALVNGLTEILALSTSPSTVATAVIGSPYSRPRSSNSRPCTSWT